MSADHRPHARPLRPDGTVSSEDVRRCGEEIKQLRNQQFILGTTALGLFGAYATLLPRLHQIRPEPDAAVFVASAIAMLGVLGFLFAWCRQLRVLIGVLNVWLEVVGGSTWEYDFRHYNTRHAPVSHTVMVSWAFLMLGIGVPALVLAVTPTGEAGHITAMWLLFGGVDVLYVG
jgi:uncharacterized Tic20 family protein